jgi:hypothetical protein
VANEPQYIVTHITVFVSSFSLCIFYISVILKMLFIITNRFIILVLTWLCHFTTSLNINAGYYVNPIFHQPLNRGRISVPQLMWSTYFVSGYNAVATQDRTSVGNENRIVDNVYNAMTHENPVVDSQIELTTRETPVVDSVSKAMIRGNGIVENQHSRKNPVTDNHNYTMTKENPVVDNQNQAMARENSVVVSQEQSLEDYSFKHTQPKCQSCPNRETKELTHRGGDSVTFVQQGESDIKRVLGGDAPMGNRTNDIPAGSTNKLFPAVADPSRCVWAIISCCSPGSTTVRNPCFELLGCPGPFWDTKPCNERITGAALKVVGQFYSNGKEE